MGRISIVQNYLKQLITDADLEITGSKVAVGFRSSGAAQHSRRSARLYRVAL
jgi:hypothetical protein